jgi:hypothetical protein
MQAAVTEGTTASVPSAGELAVLVTGSGVLLLRDCCSNLCLLQSCLPWLEHV